MKLFGFPLWRNLGGAIQHWHCPSFPPVWSSSAVGHAKTAVFGVVGAAFDTTKLFSSHHVPLGFFRRIVEQRDAQY
jgi:hypothetical protein